MSSALEVSTGAISNISQVDDQRYGAEIDILCLVLKRANYILAEDYKLNSTDSQ